jgi:hypothetical protein
MAIAVLKEPGKEAQFLVAETFVENRVWFLCPTVNGQGASDNDVIVFDQFERLQPTLKQMQRRAKKSASARPTRISLLRTSQLDAKLKKAWIVPSFYFGPTTSFKIYLYQLGISYLVKFFAFLTGKNDLADADLCWILKVLRYHPLILDPYIET